MYPKPIPGLHFREKRLEPHDASVLSFADDVDQQPDAEQAGKQIPDDAQDREPEQQRSDPSCDDHRGAYDHGGYDNAEGQTAGGIVQGFNKACKIFVSKTHAQLSPVRLDENTFQPTWNLFLQAEQFSHGKAQAAQDRFGCVTPGREFGDSRPGLGNNIQPGVDTPGRAFGGDQRLDHDHKIRRQPYAVCSQQIRDRHEQLTDFYILDGDRVMEVQ